MRKRNEKIIVKKTAKQFQLYVAWGHRQRERTRGRFYYPGVVLRMNIHQQCISCPNYAATARSLRIQYGEKNYKTRTAMTTTTSLSCHGSSRPAEDLNNRTKSQREPSVLDIGSDLPTEAFSHIVTVQLGNTFFSVICLWFAKMEMVSKQHRSVFSFFFFPDKMCLQLCPVDIQWLF